MAKMLTNAMKEQSKLWEAKRKYQRICPNCGHRVSFANIRGDKVLCWYCPTYVFKDDKAEFTYRLQERIKRQAREYVVYTFEDATIEELDKYNPDDIEFNFDKQLIFVREK